MFIEDFAIEPSTNKVTLTELYSNYKEFCKDDGYKAKGKNNFSKELERKGFEKTRMNDGAAAFLISNKNSNHF